MDVVKEKSKVSILPAKEEDEDQMSERIRHRYVAPMLVKHGNFNDLTKTGSPQIFSP